MLYEERSATSFNDILKERIIRVRNLFSSNVYVHLLETKRQMKKTTTARWEDEGVAHAKSISSNRAKVVVKIMNLKEFN